MIILNFIDFDSMLSLIPPKYYFPNNDNDVKLNKYAKNLKRKQKK